MPNPQCNKACPGCLMTFSPDIETCPLPAFEGYHVGAELDEERANVLLDRYSKFAHHAIETMLYAIYTLQHEKSTAATCAVRALKAACEGQLGHESLQTDEQIRKNV